MESTENKTPAELGYRMPAEWEPHEATWLSWPRRTGISFPDAYDAVLPALAKMVEALADSERVRISVRDGEEEEEVRGVLRKNKARAEHVDLPPHPDERAVVPRPRPHVPHAPGRSRAWPWSIGITTPGAGNTRPSTTTTTCPCGSRRNFPCRSTSPAWCSRAAPSMSTARAPC